MIPLKSKQAEIASSVHNAIMSVSEAYGRQLAELTQENATLRAELAAAKERLSKVDIMTLAKEQFAKEQAGARGVQGCADDEKKKEG